MEPVSFFSGIICIACVCQNFSFWRDPVARFIGFLCLAGAIFCFWAAFK